MAKEKLFILIIIIPIFALTSYNTRSYKNIKETMAVDFKLYSAAFEDEKLIPSKYTCDGVNISPPLNWINPPGSTKSFVLICDDLDAPIGDWVHWIVYNIPNDVIELKEEASSKKLLPKGALEGLNDFRKNNYGGPCPPSGTHRYYFKLHSLDTILPIKEKLTKESLTQLMKDHILAQATLMGKYKRQ